MLTPEEVAEKVKQEYFVAVAEMMECAANTVCTTDQEVEDAKHFLHILSDLHKDQMDVIKAIKRAGEILDAKIKNYRSNQTSLDDL
jgi:ribosomal protein L7/L12